MIEGYEVACTKVQGALTNGPFARSGDHEERNCLLALATDAHDQANATGKIRSRDVSQLLLPVKRESRCPPLVVASRSLTIKYEGRFTELLEKATEATKKWRATPPS